MATNSEFIRKKLDKSNDQDVIRWISANYIAGTPISKTSNFSTTLGKEKAKKKKKKLSEQ